VDERIVDERFVDERIVDERIVDECFVDERRLHRRVVDERQLDERELDERIVDECVLDERVLDERRGGAVTEAAAPVPAFARLLPLPAAGRSFYLLVVLGAALTAGATLGRAVPSPGDWAAFGVLAACAALAQVFIVRTGRNHGFHTAIVFVVAAALLLPPPLIVLMAIAQHGPEWIKERYPWFIQSFNIGNFALGSLAGWAAAHGVADWQLLGPHERAAAAAAAAAAVFVAINHVLLAGMLRLGRRLPFGESGLFSTESLATDLVLAGLGIALATVWRSNPWLVPAVIAPVVLSHRSFRVLGLLRDSEERFRTLFDAAPIGMVVRDLDGQLLSTNRALAQMLGYGGDGLDGVDPQSLLGAEDAARARDLLSEITNGVRDGYQSEQRYAARDGSDVFGSVDVTLVRDAGERPQFVLSMVQDVTDRKRLEEQLMQAQKMEAVGRLAGGVAHDFNNLLTAIGGYAEFAAERVRDDPEASKDIAEITKAAQRAHDLTRQLLAFSRKQILQPQIVDLEDVVGDLDGMLRRLIGENIEIVTSHRSGVALVRADPGQLHQVIVNLVVNARDEMTDGGTLVIETASTTISSTEATRRGDDVYPGSFVTLTIRDTGRGMDAATKARLFEPFFTRKDVGEGTGLGLATVYGIVKQSGGFIEVESEPGRGAAFTIFLPSLGDAAAPAQVDEVLAEPAPRGCSETILLVEDDELVRKFVQTVLGEAGYDVVVANDGHEALGRAAEQHVDLLLTDLVMPKMSGRELSSRVDVPVVYMSGYTEDLVARHGLADRDTRLILKPFTAAELKRAVRDALDRLRDDRS
jgi:PAS domain S-box-containing protein